MNAFYCEGRGWMLSADEMNKIEFRGQYANIRCCAGDLVFLSCQDTVPVRVSCQTCTAPNPRSCSLTPGILVHTCRVPHVKL